MFCKNRKVHGYKNIEAYLDELKLKMHLAEMEAREEYDRLSGKLDELTVQYDPIKNAVAESAGNVVSALALAAGEMKSGFQRVRKALKSD